MISPQIKSQFFGIMLALTTAIGCIAYERIVKNCSYFTIGVIYSLAYFPFFMCALPFQHPTGDWDWISTNKRWVVLLLICGVTSPLWYVITKNQGVAVGAVYEVKYIVMMAIIYYFAGMSPLTWNTMVGIFLAMLSVYFISLK